MCCNLCFREIAKKNTSAAKLWIDLCAHATNIGGLMAYDESKLSAASVSLVSGLEKWGYLLSTDRPKDLVIKMLGWEFDVGTDTFCINRFGHMQNSTDDENTEAIPR